MTDELREHVIKTEKLGFLVYSLGIIVLLIVKREWILSAIIGVIAAFINFRIQVKGLSSLVEGKSALHVTGNFYFRMAILGAVLFMSFSSPGLNPYVVFAFIVSFQFFVFITGLFRSK